MGEGTEASGKPTGASRATGPDQARRTTRGHVARQRGTPRATTKAYGQVPSSDGRRVSQTRRARTTRDEPRHEDRCQATPAAVRTDECAPGSEPSPCRLRNSRRPDERVCARRVPSPCGYEQPPSGRTNARPEATQPLSATNSHHPDGPVRAPQRCPANATHSPTHRASRPVNRSQGAQDTAQHTGRRQG